ncbi:MAG: PH domain-containing protein [Acidobacteriota bacterium]|nr:PH domain-containing protein [Acidobacteriota bacterium]
MGYAEKSLVSGETIVYRARHHWIFYRAGLLVLFLAALLGGATLYASKTSPDPNVARWSGYLALGFVAIAALLLIGRWIRARNDEFAVTDRRLLCSKGVLNRVHEQAPIDKIQDITINQSWMGGMLGYGDVVVETASERLGAFTFDLIAAPEAFRNAIWGHAPTVGRPAAAVPSGAPSAAARMEELENLRRKGMVSETEYADKRRQILEHL